MFYKLQRFDTREFECADTVTGVNDKTFDSSEELVKYVNSQKLGDKVKVTYQKRQENQRLERLLS